MHGEAVSPHPKRQSPLSELKWYEWVVGAVAIVGCSGISLQLWVWFIRWVCSCP